jgi:3-oxoacyl-[acyl-carrier protein] reductase
LRLALWAKREGFRWFRSTSSSLIKSDKTEMRLALRTSSASLARTRVAPAVFARRTFASGTDARPLEGKVIVVGGAGNPPEEGHGIGAMTSIVLARQGAKVVSVSNEALNAETVTNAITAEGNEAMAHVADCTKTADVDALVKAVMAKYGQVDVLINAGIHSALPMGFSKMTPEAWKVGIDLNLTAHFNLIHGFLPIFEERQKGNIIHFTTIAGSVGLGIGNQRHAYAAGKSGAATLTKRIGVEYAKKGIRGNVIGIGYVTGPLVNRAVAQVKQAMRLRVGTEVGPPSSPSSPPPLPPARPLHASAHAAASTAPLPFWEDLRRSFALNPVPLPHPSRSLPCPSSTGHRRRRQHYHREGHRGARLIRAPRRPDPARGGRADRSLPRERRVERHQRH